MTFNESDVNRDQAGKFDTKTGTAPDQELSTGVAVLNDAAARIREEGVTDEVREAIEPYLDEREDENVSLALLDVGEAALEADDEKYAWYLADRLGWLDEDAAKDEDEVPGHTVAYTIPFEGKTESTDDYKTEVIDVPADAPTATFELPSDGLTPENVATPGPRPAAAPKEKGARAPRAGGGSSAPWPVIPPGRFERFLNLIGRSFAQSFRLR